MGIYGCVVFIACTEFPQPKLYISRSFLLPDSIVQTLSDIVTNRSPREDFDMTAQYNKRQKQKRRKAKVARKKEKVRAAIAKSKK